MVLIFLNFIYLYFQFFFQTNPRCKNQPPVLEKAAADRRDRAFGAFQNLAFLKLHFIVELPQNRSRIDAAAHEEICKFLFSPTFSSFKHFLQKTINWMDFREILICSHLQPDASIA